MSGDHLNYSIFRIDQTTEKRPRDPEFDWLAVNQTPVRNRRLTLMWKTRKEVNNNKSAQETFKILWDFEEQINQLISARRLDQVIVNKNKKKRIWRIVDFAVLADLRVKLEESRKRDTYQDLARELKKVIEHVGDSATNCYSCTWNNPQRIGKGIERFE